LQEFIAAFLCFVMAFMFGGRNCALKEHLIAVIWDLQFSQVNVHGLFI